MKKYVIDPELNAILPELSETDYKALERSLLTDGFKGAPIMVWGDIIVDGHNRYEICSKHNIPYEVKTVEFENKEEAVRWMVRQQIGRRTLTPLQRIQIVEKYKPFYKKKAKENQSKAGKNYGIGSHKPSENSTKAIKGSENSTTPILPIEKIDVREELAKDADVSTNTYSKGVTILKSGNEELINETASGQKSINRAYNELKGKQKVITAVDKLDNELKNLKEVQRKEAAQNIKEAREEYGIESPEYEDAKAGQINVEVRINEIENTIHGTKTSDIESMIIKIQKRYQDYLTSFQQDIKWLSGKEFYLGDEDVSGKTHSDLQNCLEKFKSISELMQKMTIDEFGCILIDK